MTARQSNDPAATSDRQSSLDLSAEALSELVTLSVSLVADYFGRVADLPVFPETAGGQTALRLGHELSQEGEPVHKLIDDCRVIIEGSRHNGHPRFFGYVASPATPPGAFADLIASALNVSLTSW